MPKGHERHGRQGFSTQPDHLYRPRTIEDDPALTPYKYCSMCGYTVSKIHRDSLPHALENFSAHNDRAHEGRAQLVKQR